MLGFTIAHDTIDIAAVKFEMMAEAQVPFATSLALNRTAELSLAALRTQLQVVFDRPTPYTLNSLFVQKSTKSKLTVIVGHRPKASSPLLAEIEGGDRRLKSTEKPTESVLIPSRYAKLDGYGNLPSATVKLLRLAIEQGTSGSGTRTFVYLPKGNPRGLAPGVYQRTDRGLMPVVFLHDKASYTKRYDLEGIVHRVFDAEFGKQFTAAMDYALHN
jgi:hypothetical protein